MKIITVSREFGSGGRELGKRLADFLNIAYYDREIISEIASKTSLDENYVERMLDSDIAKQYSITYSHTFAHFASPVNTGIQLLVQEHKIIKELALKGDCIIVGRCADVVLSDLNPFKIFVYADMESRVKRCQMRAQKDENLTDKEMEKKIKQIDKIRANNYDLVALNRWGDKSNYNLCVNTTGVNIRGIVPIIGEYAKEWFN